MKEPLLDTRSYLIGYEDGKAVKVKELTDEEIMEIADGCLVGATAWHNPELDPIVFAKAILIKAQEK